MSLVPKHLIMKGAPILSIRAWLFWMVFVFTLPMYAFFLHHLVGEEEATARGAAYAEVEKLAHSTAAALQLTLKEHESILHLIAMEYRGNPPPAYWKKFR